MNKLIKLVSLVEYVNSDEEYLTYTQAAVTKDLIRLHPELPLEDIYFCFHKDGYFRVGTLKELRKSTPYLNEKRRSLRRFCEEIIKG